MQDFDDQTETWTVVVDADTSALQNELRIASGLGRKFSNSLVNAFEGIALKGKSLGEVMRSLALDLSNIALKSAFKPLEQGLGNLFNGVVPGGVGGGGLGAPALPIPFAKGGVVQNPMTFPFQGGRAGLMAERGAEAILPLARGPDGRLGVASSAGGGINITLNVTSPDAAGFQKSEGQIAAMLTRAVTLGGRNL